MVAVCPQTERPVEAEQALKFAIKVSIEVRSQKSNLRLHWIIICAPFFSQAGLSDPSLIGEIQDLQRACPQLSISLSQIPKTVEVA